MAGTKQGSAAAKQITFDRNHRYGSLSLQNSYTAGTVPISQKTTSEAPHALSNWHLASKNWRNLTLQLRSGTYGTRPHQLTPHLCHIYTEVLLNHFFKREMRLNLFHDCYPDIDYQKHWPVPLHCPSHYPHRTDDNVHPECLGPRKQPREPD